MNAKTFEKATALAEQRQHLMLSTTDRSGIPHIASVGGFECLSSDRVALSDWHCPATLVNLQHNNQVALVVWDIVTDMGYQLIGQVEAVRSGEDSTDPELVVRIHQVLEFNHRGHTDHEVGEAPHLMEGSGVEGSVSGYGSPDAQHRRAYLYVRRSVGV